MNFSRNQWVWETLFIVCASCSLAWWSLRGRGEVWKEVGLGARRRSLLDQLALATHSLVLALVIGYKLASRYP